jgi:hypothetical protein
MTTQGDHAAALIATTRALDARILTIQETTDPTALSWQPPSGGWTAGVVFEHLCIGHDSYLTVLGRLVANAPRNATVSHATSRWKPSFAGNLLVRSLESPKKRRAPKIYRPPPQPRPNVMQEFLDRQRKLVDLIERSMALEWQRVRMASPVSWLIRMNIGDGFTVLVVHAERHLRQIDRILEEYGSHARSGTTAHAAVTR